MPKKTLVKLEEGLTASSVALECAALLDAGLEGQLGPAAPGEEGLAEGGRLAVRAARRLLLLKHHYEAASEALSRIEDELHRWRQQRDRVSPVLYDKAKGLRGVCRGIFPGDELVKGFLKAHDALGIALTAIQKGETREKVAKAATKRAKKAYTFFLGRSCRFLEASLELAGLDELADAVRPDVGRRGRPPKENLLESAGLPGDAKALPAAEKIAALLPGDAPGADE